MTLTLYQVADCETEGRDLTSLQVIMPAGGKISATAYEKAGGGGGFFVRPIILQGSSHWFLNIETETLHLAQNPFS